MNYEDVAVALLLIAGIVAIMGIITAEATYPGYSTGRMILAIWEQPDHPIA